jgi:hypothetical protein
MTIRELTTLQNRVRGLIGPTRAKGYEAKSTKAYEAKPTRAKGYKAKRSEKAVSSRIVLGAILIDAKRRLGREEYKSFLDWTIALIKTQAPSIEESPYTFQELARFPTKTSEDLVTEITSASELLLRHVTDLTLFRSLADRVENSFWESDHATTFLTLDSIETNFGGSFWLIEAELAFRQAAFGIEEQKEYASRLRREAKRSVAAFVAYYVGVRNEPSVTANRFPEDTFRRLQRTRLPESGKIYLYFRLVQQWPSSLRGLATILMVEQTSSIIDLYETLIRIAQRLAITEPNPALRTHLASRLTLLKDIPDTRIERLIAVLTGAFDNLRINASQSESFDLLLSGKLKASLYLASRKLAAQPGDINELITAAYCLSFGKPTSLNNRSLQNTIMRNLAVVLSKTGDFERAVADLRKLTLNFAFLPSMRALKEVCELEGLPRPNDIEAKLLSRFLDSAKSDDIRSYFNSLDVLSLVTTLRPSADSSPTYDFVRGLQGLGGGNEAVFSAAAKSLVKSIGPPRLSGHVSDLSNLRELAAQTSFPRTLRMPAILYLIDFINGRGEIGEAVEFLIREFMEDNSIQRLLPIQTLVGVDTWHSLKSLTKSISIPIALDLRWRETNDDRIATYRRFSTHQFLLKNGVSSPSELYAQLSSYPTKELIYFLRYVSVQSVLDMMPTFKSSQELDEERRRICALLESLDKDNAITYQDEVLEITNRLTLQQGLQVLDSSRIHVDNDGIERWVKLELAESFRRYLSLVEAGIGISEDFDIVLKLILKSGFVQEDYLEIPSSEADTLLVQIVSEIFDRCLNDSSYGLNSYLSQRIRHGSLQIYLRSPVEKEQLVTQKDSGTGRYEQNIYWLDKLSIWQPAQRREVDQKFVSFSTKIDGIIIDLKDKYLNVKTSERPHGLFWIEWNAPVFHIIRSLAQQDKELSTFTKACITFFWPIINPSLGRARKHLLDVTRSQAATAFEELRADLIDVAGDHPAFADLSNAIGDASAKIQAEIERIADWLRRREGDQDVQTYSLKQAFQISIDSALSSHRAFSPEIKQNIDSDLRIGATDLTTLADIVRVAIGNVKDHAHTAAPKIEIEASVQDEKLAIVVLSNVSPEVRTQDLERRLDEIRKQIEARAFSTKLSSQGGTGFFKIASVVQQSPNGSISFGFEGENQFRLVVDLPFLPRS